MGFFSFLGHRLLAVFLFFLGPSLLIVGILPPPLGLNPTWLYVTLGIMALVSCAYFLDTEH